MKKVREWAPWVKMVVGGAGFAVGIAQSFLQFRAYQSTGEASGGIHSLGSLFFLAGLILLIWGGFGALIKHPRLLGGVILATGLLLLPATVLSLPSLWEWAKGGVVNFIPAPFLVPIVLVIPGLLIYYGIQGIRGK